MGGRPLAVAGFALVGGLACGPISGASPAWAAAEHKPAAANSPAATTAGSAPELVPPPADGVLPAALLAPVAHAPLALFAPSYAGWLTDPPRGALPVEKFAARRQVVAEIEVFQRVIAVPPPAPPSSAVTALPVPLPPKRLAEQPRIVLASLAPLPPRRLVGPFPVVPQETAAPEEIAAQEVVPDDATAPRDDAAEPDANAAAEDAAQPIDDAPEPVATRATADRAPPHIEALLQRHAERFDVPVWLVRRVAWRESKFDPGQRNGPYWGLMQIRVDTARGLGFRGAPKDLLDANTNLTYAVAYLANAYRVAGRDEKRAVTLYAKGYYYEAKRKGMRDSLIRTAVAEE
ncbi:transglycosylase SLT domain-containing protein [Ancylobacter sp. VNQ12]|uniref:transglycosylase SLT domain-containing protein n=1 Tax=Ancylobacter sp. VNQ12 TaxID=3400920 RepID=UPI003C017724